MAGTIANRRRHDPYRNFKFRVMFEGTYVAGVSKVAPKARREDLLLTGAARTTLGRIITRSTHPKTVLFVGPAGSGKSLAAEVIAGELGTTLYHVALSKVASKYIGETEKHLEKVFAAAEVAGAVLFFDEADALFGRRTRVRTSHHRYANMAIGYLLMKLESFNGVAILATNTKQALDPAFLRRLRFVITFPLPDDRPSR
jgi:SpoVK/Ycf46/Vps4 family AAA+-type ATPase